MAPSVHEIAAPAETLGMRHLLDGTKISVSPSCCVTEVDNSSATAEQLAKISNPSLQVTADHKIKMVEAPILRPGPGDVLIHVKATGICGYDSIFLQLLCQILPMLTRRQGQIFTFGERVQ